LAVRSIPTTLVWRIIEALPKRSRESVVNALIYRPFVVVMVFPRVVRFAGFVVPQFIAMFKGYEYQVAIITKMGVAVK
jgi:type II secretory pathway component PulF